MSSLFSSFMSLNIPTGIPSGPIALFLLSFFITLCSSTIAISPSYMLRLSTIISLVVFLLLCSVYVRFVVSSFVFCAVALFSFFLYVYFV